MKLLLLLLPILCCLSSARFLQQTPDITAKTPREILALIAPLSASTATLLLNEMINARDVRLIPVIILMSTYKVNLAATSSLPNSLKQFMQGSLELVMRICLESDSTSTDGVNQAGWCMASDSSLPRDSQSHYVSLQKQDGESIVPTQQVFLVNMFDTNTPYFTIENNAFTENRACLMSQRAISGDNRNEASTFVNFNNCQSGNNKNWIFTPTADAASFQITLQNDASPSNGINQSGWELASLRNLAGDQISASTSKMAASNGSVNGSNRFTFARMDL